MSIIDWSDPEEMLGLLAESIRDEIVAQSRTDHERIAFLRALSKDVHAIASRDATPNEALAALREVSEAQSEDFANDPALIHVNDCIQELERILIGR